jgi:hypothetical protein
MQKHKKNIANSLSFLLILSLFACEEFTDWKTKPDGVYIIIDALITNELKNQEVYIYTSVDTLNGIPEPISGVNIKILSGSSEIAFTETTPQSGKYVSIQPFSVAAGIEYKLIVEYNGIHDTASSEVVAITPLEPIDIVPYQDNYRLTYSESSSPSMMEVYYDWSSQQDFCTSHGSCYAAEIFYILKNIDASSMFAPDKEIITFPQGTTIIRKKYSLNSEHQEFLRSLLLETEWRGGAFDIEPGNVRTNFKHGTLGWFGTTMVLVDTTIQ